MKLARAFLAILAWIGAVGSSPVFGHSHKPHSHSHESAEHGYISHEHSYYAATQEPDDDHDAGPQIEESVFHLHTAWLGIAVNLPAASTTDVAGRTSSIPTLDAHLVDVGPGTPIDPAWDSPLAAPAWCAPYDLLATAKPRSPFPHSSDGLLTANASCLRSVNLRC